MNVLFFLLPALLLFAWLSQIRFHRALILLAGLLPTYLFRFSLFGLPANFFEAAVGIAVITGLFQAAVRARWLAALRRLPRSLLIWSVLFVVSGIISTIISPELRVSLGILKGWIIVPMIFGFMVSVDASITKTKDNILRSLLLSGNIVAIIGLGQIGHFGRLQSIYDTPNSLALFLAPIFVLGVWQRFPFPYLFPIGLALLGTLSLSAAVAVGLALCCGAWLWLPQKTLTKFWKYGAVAGVLAIVVFSVSGKLTYLARPFFDSATHSSLSVRWQLWSIAADLVRDHPLLGIGLGQFEGAYQNKLHERFIARPQQPPLAEFVYRDPHNWPLAFWLNLGLPGLISFIAVHYLVLVPLVSGAGKASKVADQAITLALLTLLIFGLADTIYWKNDLAALHWLLLLLIYF